MMPLVLLFFLSLACSFALCLLLVRSAGVFGLMDFPGERKLQQTPVPRAGGLAIFFTFILLGLVFDPTLPSLTMLGACVVYIGGLYDDRRPTNTVFVKLLFQLSGAALAATDLYLHYALSPGLSILSMGFVLVMINAFNLMDNMNGLTAGMTIVLIVTFKIMDLISPLEAVILGGAVAGFFFLNFPWGRIFLGDQGSQFLGYFMSTIALRTLATRFMIEPGWGTLIFGVGVLLLAFLPFILDTALVVVIRWRNGAPITSGDQNHLSHQLARFGFSYTVVALLIVTLQAVCAVSCYLWGKHWPGLA